MAGSQRAVVLTFLGNDAQLKSVFASVQKDALATDGALSRIGRVGKGLTTFGQAMSKYVTLPILAVGAASVKTALAYDTSMNRVAALTDMNGRALDLMSTKVLALSKNVAIGPDELANALYFVASSGFKGQKALDVLTSSAEASAAGLGDTGTIAKTLDSVLNAYAGSGLTAAKATDYMIAAVRNGDLPATALAGSLGNVLSIASQMGVPFKDVVAAVAAASKQGIDAAKTVQGLRFMLSRLLDPTAAATKVMAAYGLSAEGVQNSIRNKGLLATLQMLEDKLGAANFSKMVGGARGLSTALALIGKNKVQVQGVFAAVNDAPGSLARAFATAQQSPAFKLRQQKVQLQVAGIQIGNDLLPTLERLAQSVAKIANAFSNLSPHVQDFIVRAAVLLAAIGPVAKILGTLLKVVGPLGTVFRVLGSAVGILGKGLFLLFTRIAVLAEEMPALGAAIDIATGPVGWIIGAITLLTIGFIELWKHSTGFRNFFKGLGRDIAGAADAIGRFAKRIGSDVANGFMVGVHAVTSFADAIGNFATRAYDDVKHVIDDIIGFFEKLYKAVEPVLRVLLIVSLIPLIAVLTIIGYTMKGLAVIAGIVFRAIRVVVETVFNAIKSVALTVISWLVRYWTAEWNIVVSVFTTIAHAISAVWSAVTSALVAVFTPVVHAVITLATALWHGLETVFNALSSVVSAVWNALATFITVVWDKIAAFLTKAWHDFAAVVSRVWDTMFGPLHAAFNAVATFATAAWNAVYSVFATATTKVGQLLAALGKAISSVASTMWDGIADGFVDVINFVIGAWDALRFKTPTIDVFGHKVGGLDVGTFQISKLPKPYADGGIVGGKTFAMLGEAGREAVIPLTRRSRALDIMRQSGLDRLVSSAQPSGGSTVNVGGVYVTQTSGSPAETARHVAWALRTV